VQESKESKEMVRAFLDGLDEGSAGLCFREMKDLVNPDRCLFFLHEIFDGTEGISPFRALVSQWFHL
jgi:hypothetical protein